MGTGARLSEGNLHSQLKLMNVHCETGLKQLVECSDADLLDAVIKNLVVRLGRKLILLLSRFEGL